MFDDPDHPFIFMPSITDIQVEPFRFKWRGASCTYDEATRMIVCDDEAAESDPALHSWLQSIFD